MCPGDFLISLKGKAFNQDISKQDATRNGVLKTKGVYHEDYFTRWRTVHVLKKFPKRRIKSHPPYCYQEFSHVLAQAVKRLYPETNELWLDRTGN